MNAHRAALAGLSALPLALALALAAGCSAEEAAGGSAVAPADEPARATDVSAAVAAASPGVGRPEVLDTGVDLSHLRRSEEGTAFPAAGARPRPQNEPEPAPSGPPGELAVPEGEESHDFGELVEGDRVRHVFRLRAQGENPLVVQRVKPSCGCTAAEIHLVKDEEREIYRLGGEIEPGTEFEIPVELDTTGRSGKVRTDVAVYSNDPAGVTRLQLQAQIEPLLAIEPALISFDRITSVDQVEGEATIKSSVLEPFALRIDEATLKDPLVAELSPIDPDEEGKSREWRLTLRLGPGTKEGVQRFQLRLVTDVEQPEVQHDHEHPEPHGPQPVKHRSVVANVHAVVTGLVLAEPNFLSLGLVRPGHPVERSFVVRTLDEDFELPEDPSYRITDLFEEDLPWADHFDVGVERAANGEDLDVTVRLGSVPEGFEGSFGGMLKLGVGHPTKEELNVRFSGVCRPGVGAAPATPRRDEFFGGAADAGGTDR